MKPASFVALNYSLRPSKTIQRGLVFEGLRRLQDLLNWRDPLYVGFGSIWFTDFIIAHKILGISRMISIEANLIGYRRAKFNKPYSFVRVKNGVSYDVLPQLYEQVQFKNRPSIIWLDYDAPLGESMLDELRLAVENLNADSALITTFDASEKHYGKNPDNVIERLGELFGEFAVERIKRSDVRGGALARTMARLVSNVLANTSRRISKSNACIPAFEICYRDKASMATVGAVFPHPDRAKNVQRAVKANKWPGFVNEMIVAPHLTGKEVAVLQAQLPGTKDMSRSTVQSLGFDLEEDQISAFRDHYRHYPTFAQILS